MTGGERSQVEDGRTRPDGPVHSGPAKVIVVARDSSRQVQYEASLRVAGTPALATADADAGADLLVQHHPSVLVLDSGLPRLALFRLYGLARQDEGAPPTQVVFVGQDDDTGPDDHYLPGDPPPARVAVQVSTLIARLEEDATDEHDGPAPATGVTPASSTAQAPSATASAGAASERPAAAVGAAVPAVAAASASAADRPASTETEPAPDAPRKSGRRLDVMLVRIGLVLLILGGLLFLLQMQMSSGPLVTPTLAPAAPTRRPSPSPSPSAALTVDAPAVGAARVMLRA
jgi:CheY-like chemotaxis protein